MNKYESIDFYSGMAGPSAFGSGGLTTATGGPGNSFGRDGNFLIVSYGYKSGERLSGSDY